MDLVEQEPPPIQALYLVVSLVLSGTRLLTVAWLVEQEILCLMEVVMVLANTTLSLTAMGMVWAILASIFDVWMLQDPNDILDEEDPIPIQGPLLQEWQLA